MLNALLSFDNFPTPTSVLLIFFFVLIFRFLRILSWNEEPVVIVGNWKLSSSKNESTNFLNDVLDKCTILREKYVPTLIWGRNGHLQTAVYGILGHAALKRNYDHRYHVKLDTDPNTTITFDVFEPIRQHDNKEDFTLILVPGIANSSESNYIRTCVHYAQEHGYRCAVLNHLGALKDVRLTSNNIFSYGGTNEIHTMFRQLCSIYPSTRYLAVGFSMGANIITRFLSEINDSQFRDRILLGMSVCQGYCVKRGVTYYHDWENGRRIYNYIITENMKRLLHRHYERAVLPHSKSGIINEERIWSCTSILALDEHYSRRVRGFPSVQHYYESSSCLQRIPDIATPIVFVNTLDDPLVPEPLWRPVRDLCASGTTHHAFVLVKHGGHLGFLEGGALKPNSISWLDRFICQVADAAILSA